MMGTPARTNTLSWREKCMTSLRGTFFLVTSNWRTLFFSETSIVWYPRSRRARWAAPGEAADSVPVTFFPVSSTAL